MDLSSKNESLLLNCNDKNYIKKNFESLKSYFASEENLDFLKLALTTKRNILALKTIQQLGLKIIPHIYINPYTYRSLFWLNKMKVIPEDEFQALKTRFRAIKNFENLFKETEKNFIELQIRKKRQIYRSIKVESNRIDKITTLGYKEVDRATFMFFVDDILDVEVFSKDFTELIDKIFSCNLETLETSNSDPQKELKIGKFREIKTKLYKHPTRSFSQYLNQDQKIRDQIETLMKFISKIRKFGYKFYICSNKPLPYLLCFVYLCFNNVDLTKTMCLKSINELPFPISGRKIFFGSGGNVSWELLNTAFEEFSYMLNEKLIAEDREK